MNRTDSTGIWGESSQMAAAGLVSVRKAGKSDASDKSGETEITGKPRPGNYGRTVGNPELSEQAEKYYRELKKKYGNMEFILVSEDRKEQTQAQTGQYANPNRMVVLIDTAKIERMAEDENYRKQYESIISNAAMKMSMSKNSFGVNSSRVKSYGMKVNDGGLTSFFAVVDKSLAAQKKRIEKNAAKKAADQKKAAKAAEERRMEKRKTARDEAEKRMEDAEDTVTVTASSWEELVKKVNDVISEEMSGYIRTEEELMRGQHFDFRS